MEREKKFKLFIYLMIGLITVLVFIAAYKVEKNHEEKLYLAVHQKIKEAAKDCYLKSECEGKITLQDLYDKKYLEKIIDPVSKEDMDEEMCLEYVKEIIEFCQK